METLTRGELIAALAMAVAFFLYSYLVSPRKSVPLLICLIPFQPIVTAYGTSTVMLAYVIAVVQLLKGRINYLPLLLPFSLIIAVYVLSTGLAHPNTRMSHSLYIVNFLSAILLFFVVYNFVREEKDIGLMIRTFVILNLLVAAYCILQMTFGRIDFFGLGAYINIDGYREDMRLVGPFEAVEITAEYFVLNILMFAYFLVSESGAPSRKIGWYMIIALNIGLLLATASRGSFLVFIGGGALFLFAFRKHLGIRKTMSLGISAGFLLAVASVFVISFTNFGNMYDRLATTEIENGVPDTRVVVWSEVIPRLGEKPILGQGPTLRMKEHPYLGYDPIPYPHSLYLFLMYTIGGVGLTCYLFLFFCLFQRFRWAHKASDVVHFRGIALLGMVLLVAFLVDELRIEAMRMALTDYWHFLFVLFAFLLAICDMARAEARTVKHVDMNSNAPGLTSLSS